MVGTTVRDATHRLLRDLGMTTVFGNPGSTELRLFANFAPDLRYVLALQESSAVAMADGFAQVTGNAAFVNLHSAVGVGHASGSIFTAARNHAPLVITAGQQTRAMLLTKPFLFAEEATELPKPYVKWGCEPARAEDVPAAIARAYHTAMQRPCGPTFVSIPEDDWEAPADPVISRRVNSEFVGNPDALAAVAEAINASRHPALVVGPGVDRDGAWDLAVDLAERAGATVWVSPLSGRCSFPEDHPAFGGFLTPRRETLRAQLRPFDVVVVLGAPVFTYHVHNAGAYVEDGTQLYQLVDDPDAAAFAPVGTAVVTTLKHGIGALLPRLVPAERPPARGRKPSPAPQPSEPISGAFVMHTLARLMPADAVVVEEAPSHRNALHDFLPIRHAGGFFAGASGGLGYALPASVGVALGSPDTRLVCLLGDGSSLYSIQALWTAVQHRLPITYVILNNGGYSALKAFSAAMKINDPPGVDLPGIDLTQIAGGFGCPARRVERSADLEDALQASLATPGPTLVDIAVDRAVERLY
jgi:benzoylformate decarboxylase